MVQINQIVFIRDEDGNFTVPAIVRKRQPTTEGWSQLLLEPKSGPTFWESERNVREESE